MFDPAAAGALAAALLQLADSLEVAARSLGASAAGAAVDWKGFTRRWFDGHQADVETALRHAAARCREEAASVVVAPLVNPLVKP